ncbi:MAG: hypothetical protein K8S87_10230 [Planctomycetes bacterium]|nr:hypothetical protein [Planctomycetota bacterium]
MSKLIEFKRPEVAAAIEHLDALSHANESVITGKQDSILLSQKAIDAFEFFDVTLVSKLGIRGAANFLQSLPDIEPKIQLIDYYLNEKNLKNICINKAYLKSVDPTPLISSCEGNNDISSSCIIDFKPEKGIEDFDISFNIMNQQDYVRPFVPIVVEAFFSLNYRHLSIKNCNHMPVKKFFYLSPLGGHRTDTIPLHSFVDCSKLTNGNIKISNIRFCVSVPKFRSLSPLSSRQSSRKIPVLLNINAA